jgi:hypothetical protein
MNINYIDYNYGSNGGYNKPSHQPSQPSQPIQQISAKYNTSNDIKTTSNRVDLSSSKPPIVEDVPPKVTTNDDSSLINETTNDCDKYLQKYPPYFTTQKIQNTTTAKLSYTVYQLELLNAIYIDMKYPNSVQKTLIAKLIGITRDQVKVMI